MLITGSLWARPIWGTWWSWDARLTTTLLLWFIYVGYLMLRSSVDDEQRGARYAAVLGIVGALDIPIIHQSVVWWRSLHPESVVLAAGGPAMPPSMLTALAISLVAFTVLYVVPGAHFRTRLELAARRCSGAAPGGVNSKGWPEPVEGNLVFLFAAAVVVWSPSSAICSCWSGRLSALSESLERSGSQHDSWADDEHVRRDERRLTGTLRAAHGRPVAERRLVKGAEIDD